VTVKVTQGRGEIVGNIEVAHGATRSLDAGNALKWSGATHFVATETVAVAPDQQMEVDSKRMRVVSR